MSKSRIQLTLLALSVAAAATAATACSKSKGQDGGKEGGGAAAGPTAEAATLTVSGFSVEVQVPKGWTKAEFGSGLLFSHTGQGILPSTYFITPGCQGDCSKIAANVTGFIDEQKRQHEAAGYQVKIVSQGALAGGGREFRLDVTKGREAMNQVVAVHHQEGWEEAVTCSATLLKDDRAHADAFARWCRELKIAKK